MWSQRVQSIVNSFTNFRIIRSQIFLASINKRSGDFTRGPSNIIPSSIRYQSYLLKTATLLSPTPQTFLASQIVDMFLSNFEKYLETHPQGPNLPSGLEKKEKQTTSETHGTWPVQVQCMFGNSTVWHISQTLYLCLVAIFITFEYSPKQPKAS